MWDPELHVQVEAQRQTLTVRPLLSGFLLVLLRAFSLPWARPPNPFTSWCPHFWPQLTTSTLPCDSSPWCSQSSELLPKGDRGCPPGYNSEGWHGA